MPTSSFNKDFTLRSKKAVDSFINIKKLFPSDGVISHLMV